MLREIYQKLRNEESLKQTKQKKKSNVPRVSEFNKDQSMKIKLSQMRTQVKGKKMGQLSKAFKQMEEILPHKADTEFINDQTFS